MLGRVVWCVAQMLRSGDRRRVEAKVYEELGISDEQFSRLPRKLQVAAWEGEVLACTHGRLSVPNAYRGYEC